MTNRALVIVDPDGVVQWSWEGDTPGDLPGANLIFDGLAAAQLSDLGSRTGPARRPRRPRAGPGRPRRW